MSEQGWIKLHRQIRYNGLWPNGDKYSPLEAWLDLLLSANYNGNKILVDGKMVSIARGEFITSIVKIAARWGWDRKTVRRYLFMLQSENMVSVKCTSKNTSITIAKYDFYQSGGTTESPPESPAEGTGNPQQNPHNEEVKKVKKVKNISNTVSKFIPPTIEEVRAYCLERKNNVNISKWFAHYESNGWKVGKNPMKSWKGAVITWEDDNGTHKPDTNGSNGQLSAEARRFNSRPLD